MISFYGFAAAPDDVQKLIKGVSKKEFQWVAIADDIDEWSDFSGDGGYHLRAHFNEGIDFNYLFRDGKPVIIFFGVVPGTDTVRARIR